MQRDRVLDCEGEVLVCCTEAPADHKEDHSEKHKVGVPPGEGKRTRREGEEHHAGHDVTLPYALGGDELADPGGGDDDAEHHRQGDEARRCRRESAPVLEVLAKEYGGSEHDRARTHDRDDREDRVAVEKDLEGDQRLGAALLDDNEEGGSDDGGDEQDQCSGVDERDTGADHRNPDKERNRGDRHEARTGNIKMDLAGADRVDVEAADDDPDRADHEWNRHPEAPAPAQPGRVDYQAAEKRA